MKIFKALLVCFIIFGCGHCWGSSNGKVKLKDIQTLTLHSGEMTTGRRSSPVSQLKCVGGTAGCSAFKPQVVQCYNKGFDGQDVQWECKTDMDNLYRFGRIQVTCEGYDYADDPYILKGSCGLEYTLDLTKEGHQKSNQGQHNYYGNDHHTSYEHSKGGSSIGNLLVIAVAGIVFYAIYKNCTANRRATGSDEGYSGDPPPYPQRPSWFGGGGGGGYPSAPPPPGFRQDYTQDTNTGCGGNSQSSGSSGGGFFSGAAMGGLLGYMLGNRNNDQYASRPRYSTYQSFGGTGESTYRSSSSGGSSSSGTRTASGFGGTSRR